MLLSLETSFTGKDLLLTVLRAGNFYGNFAFGGSPNGLSTLETAFQEDSGSNSLGIDKLFYQFPVANSLTFTLGARVGQEDMLAVWPSAYPTDAILDVTTLNGAPAAYNKNLGVGAGASWSADNGFSVSANYVAAQGSSSDPNAGGIGTEFSEASGSVQIAYESENWNIAAIWSGVQSPGELVGGFGTQFAAENYFSGSNSYMNAWGIGGSWQPQNFHCQGTAKFSTSPTLDFLVLSPAWGCIFRLLAKQPKVPKNRFKNHRTITLSPAHPPGRRHIIK